MDAVRTNNSTFCVYKLCLICLSLHICVRFQMFITSGLINIISLCEGFCEGLIHKQNGTFLKLLYSFSFYKNIL